jgi:hypothetical protein
MTSNNMVARPTWDETDLQASTTSIGALPAAGCCVVTNAGYVQRVMAAAGGTTTGTVTVAVAINGGSDIANSTLQILAGSGARAGNTIELPVAVSTSAVYVNEGDYISFTPSGGGGSSITGAFSAVIRNT